MANIMLIHGNARITLVAYSERTATLRRAKREALAESRFGHSRLPRTKGVSSSRVDVAPWARTCRRATWTAWT
jgi:hypothetical protein